MFISGNDKLILETIMSKSIKQSTLRDYMFSDKHQSSQYFPHTKPEISSTKPQELQEA